MNDTTNNSNSNLGDRNTGYYNTGHCNSGNCNSGSWNSGDYNSASSNSGSHNSGDHNSGDHNSNDYNSGDHNSGDHNSGDWNSGGYNSGNHNSGYFCSTDGPVMFFNKPWEGTHEQARKLIPYIQPPASYKWDSRKWKVTEVFPLAWAEMDDKTKQRFLNLPNFDPEVFLICTGVDVRKIQKPKTQPDAQMNNNTGGNMGTHNTNDHNTGVGNSGDHNTGNHNTGDHNSGDWNSGSYNSGGNNIGFWNSGHYNLGSRNSGVGNSGDHNSGNWNSGDYNSGDYNSGDYNTGYFCSIDGPVMFFNKPWKGTHKQARRLIPYVGLPMGCEWVSQEDMTDDEKHEGGYLHIHDQKVTEAFPLAWAKMGDRTKQRFLGLPNFDPEVFLACTGVDVTKTQTDIQEEAQTDIEKDLLLICQRVVDHFEAADNLMPDRRQAKERELVKAIEAAIATSNCKRLRQ